MNEDQLSCVDCGVTSCSRGDQAYPEFCFTASLDRRLLEEVKAEYRKEDINRIAVAAAEVEADHYCQLTRIEEIMEFARGVNAEKLGIATCVGLIAEARTAARIFRKNGFTVVGAACKCGAVRKTEIGIPERCEAIGPTMCNPIL